ncbi:phage late control D family protein [Francisella sp. SYW-9]|uniref:phage late control D family protein n=1 Tax=Francisella sp. SYW-9 TaxID=2610888 RepID=UPI00123E0650|nr:contractile injection system protein, VgrG/Pvc8 family [Francisella sp. SYW-9]
MVVDFQLTADGKDITNALKELGSYSITITDNIGQATDTLSIDICDNNTNLKMPATSSKLDIKLGYKNNLLDFGIFFVNDIRYSYTKNTGQTIGINASSIPFTSSDQYKSMLNYHDRSYSNTTLGNIVTSIADTYNLEPVIDKDIANIQIKHIAQHSESDIAFLYLLANKVNAIFKPTFGKLIFLKNKKGVNSKSQPIKPITLDISDIASIDYVSSNSAKYKSVKAKYHDTDTGKTSFVAIGKGDPVFVLSYTYPNEEQAESLAQKQYDSFTLDSDTIHLTTTGNIHMLSGLPIKITNLRDDIPQDWYIKTANHSISKDGYVTTLELTLKES